MSRFKNKVLSCELKDAIQAYGVIAGAGGPFWHDAQSNIISKAEEVDKLNIPFALLEDGNLLQILVNKSDEKIIKQNKI